jgi:putative AlgH/UPF0301 family transcriptional regulator
MDTRRSRFFAWLAAAGLLVAASAAVHAQALDKPRVLVASPKAEGPYAGAVVVVVPSTHGHVGFMINRASHLTVAQAFPGEPTLAKLPAAIYYGGPHDARRMYAVVRRDPGEGAEWLFGDVFLAVAPAAMDRVIEAWPDEARYFSGFVAWHPGALSQEVRDGAWLVVEPSAAQLFGVPPAELWSDLVRRIQNTL